MNNISAYPKRPRTSLQVNQEAPTVFLQKRTSGLARKCWIVKTVFLQCFYCGEMMILNMVDFSGIKKQPQNVWRIMGPSLENAMTVAFLVRPCLQTRFPAHATALPSAWAKSLLPLDQCHCHICTCYDCNSRRRCTCVAPNIWARSTREASQRNMQHP